MTMTRTRALAALGAFAIAPACSRGSSPASVAVGSKNFTEELIIGELYAQSLEKHGISVTRKLNLGGTQIAMAALEKGEIDLYPEYTGTALLNQLKAAPMSDAKKIYDTVRREYAQRYNLVWLDPAPMNDTQALATTQAISAKYHITTLSQLARAAPQLRMGAIPEFVGRADGLPGLQQRYGGFKFKDVRLFDIGLRYKALLSGDVDVVVAFGTDGQIDADHLVVFKDDKHLWPAYQVAPVVRKATLDRVPAIASVLNPLAPLLTDATMRRLNWQVDGSKRDPADVARGFLAAHPA